MDAYEVHKKIQEAVMAVEVYKLTSKVKSNTWHPEILQGLDELTELRQTLDPVNKPTGRIKIGKVWISNRSLHGVSEALTKREEQILRFITTGKKNSEIAEKLDLSVKTVETNRHNILLKLGADSSEVEAV